MQLEGISDLVGDFVPMLVSNQNLTKQNNNCEASQPIPTEDVFSSLREGEGIKEGGQLPNDEFSNKNSKKSEGSAVEWKKVEDILSQLGL